MPKLPRLSGQTQSALERLGFTQVRQLGSHIVMKRIGPNNVTGCVVPLHAELATGTLRRILKQAGATTEESIGKL
jgi:predicted RNA binding protein YcfA (HicA-like mRNA interferase family)